MDNNTLAVTILVAMFFSWVLGVCHGRASMMNEKNKMEGENRALRSLLSQDEDMRRKAWRLVDKKKKT